MPEKEEPTDARKITTPIGAVLGLLTVRGLLPEDKRDALTYAAGTGIGAGAGFLAGTYANPYGKSIEKTVKEMVNPSTRPIDRVYNTLGVLNKELDANPVGEPSSTERGAIMDLLGQSDYRSTPGGSVDPVDPASSHKAYSSAKGDVRRLQRNWDALRNDLSSRRARTKGMIQESEDAAARADNMRKNINPDVPRGLLDPALDAGRYVKEKAFDAVGRII
jgi:hypothetical protein